MSKIETYTSFAEKIAADQSHGYSQANRWGSPDYDCSSLVITALEKAGIPAKSKGATYTGNIPDVLPKVGFKNVKSKVNLSTGSGLKRGDILMYHKSGNIGHICIYQGNGKIVHARGSSYGSSAAGDQGTEIQANCPYYNAPWQYVFRYTGDNSSTSTGKTTAKPAAKESYAGSCLVTLPEMVEGSIGPKVKLVQHLLNRKGYVGKDGKKLDEDGEYGENTVYAITLLQKNAGMHDIWFGTISAKTWALLLN